MKASSLFTGLTASCLLIAATTFANNFYLGASGGYQSTYNENGGISNEFENEDSHTAYYNVFALDVSGHGPVGNIFAGYSLDFNNHFFTALELNAEYASAPITRFDQGNATLNGVRTLAYSARASVHQNGSLGVTIRPGFDLTPDTKLYAIAGGEWTKYSGSDTLAFQEQGAPDINLSMAQQKWLGGFRYGVGINIALSKTLNVRGEFDRTAYTVWHLNSNPPEGVLEQDLNLKPVTDEVLLGLAWNIA